MAVPIFRSYTTFTTGFRGSVSADNPGYGPRRASPERIFSPTGWPPAQFHDPMTVDPDSTHEASSLVDFRNVTVLRNGNKALDSITLSITLGQHVAILGPNGSGKSSLIKTITRECHPLDTSDDSRLTVLGQRQWNIFDLRPRLGIVSPDWTKVCDRDISAREAILTGFFGSAEMWPNLQATAEMESRAEQVLGRMEIAHLARRRVSEMSSGEARRVLIARGLVHGPRTLILDEPATSLDLRARRGLRETLRKIARSGTGVVLVTHDPADIFPEINRVVLLKGGRVLEDGRKEDILASAHLSRLFGMPVELVERNGYYHLLDG